jgi:hypothetical protein
MRADLFFLRRIARCTINAFHNLLVFNSSASKSLPERTPLQRIQIYGPGIVR